MPDLAPVADLSGLKNLLDGLRDLYDLKSGLNAFKDQREETLHPSSTFGDRYLGKYYFLSGPLFEGGLLSKEYLF